MVLYSGYWSDQLRRNVIGRLSVNCQLLFIQNISPILIG